MNVNQKANLIVEFYKAFRSDPDYRLFFRLSDYGVSVAAYAFAGMDPQEDLVDPDSLDNLSSDDVDRIVSNTWERICHEFESIDPDLEFSSLSELLDFKKPYFSNVDEIVKALEGLDEEQIFELGEFSNWTISAFEQLIPMAFAADENYCLRYFVYGGLHGLPDRNCSCSKEHRLKFDPYREMLQRLNIEELPETGYRTILEYMVIRATKQGLLDKVMSDYAFEYDYKIKFDAPSYVFLEDGSLDPVPYEIHRDVLASQWPDFNDFLEITKQSFLQRGDFVYTNLRDIESDMLVDSGEGLKQAIKEYEFLRDDLSVISEEDFVNFVYEDENWYPKDLYIAVANRSNVFPGVIPAGTETRWSYDLSVGPDGYYPWELQEILMLIPRFRVFSRNESLEEVLEDCFSVFINPMPALVATRPETPDEKRIEIIKAYADPSNGFDFSEFDEQVGSEETYSNSLEVTAAALYVKDVDALTQLNNTDSTLIKHAIFLNPALPAEVRKELSESLDLDYIKEDLEGFISAAEESRDLDFADLLKTFRG